MTRRFWIALALAAARVPTSVLAEEAEDSGALMARLHAADAPQASPAATAEPAREVTAEEVAYATIDGAPVTGYLARPAAASGPLPGILVIQEWWGLNDNIRAMTRRLAAEGYAALAVDLYEGHLAADAAEARRLVQAVSAQPERLRDNLRQAYRYLSERAGAPKVGTIGWCFGGGWSLQTALLLPDQIDATVIYYGQLVSDRERLATLQMPILGIFGALDQGIPPDVVRAFEALMKELGKDISIHIYDGADHAFANPSGGRYKDAAATDAWAKTAAFFAEHLK